LRCQNSNIFFWRDHHGIEVDLIIEHANGLIPVEIKSAKTWNRDFFLNLKKWNNYSGSLADKSFVVYGGDESIKTASGMLLSWKSIDEIGAV
jgi:hypothetical protein